jgi:hypothetical protein
MSDKFIVTHADENKCLGDILAWNYELPAMLFPLFAAKPTDTSSFLECEAQEGYQLLKEMYEFLAKHKDKVFDQPDEFLAYKAKILKELKPVGDRYFLDGERMFAVGHIMDDDGVKLSELTAKLYADIEKVNVQIKSALADDDIEKFWGIMTGEDNEACVNDSLGEYFQNKNQYMYGYAPLSISTGSWVTKDTEVEIYSENDKKGLKLVNGGKLIEAKYDAIYAFDNSSDIAVVNLNDKFGYIDKKGNEFIPLMYEDVFDFWGTDRTFSDEGLVTSGVYRGSVVKEGKYGVIDEKNSAIIPCEWDDIYFKEPDNYFIPNFICVEKNGKTGIYDLNGEEKYPVIIDEFFLGDNTYEDRNKNYPICGFPKCLWVKVEDKWFYLNNQFKPYGQGLHIKDNGESLQNIYALEDGVEGDKNICLFIVRNEEWFWGVISSNDDIIVPIKYRSIDILNVPNGSKNYFT